MGDSHVAVVVVHGVGDPGAGISQRSIGSILLALRDANDHTEYQPFECESLEIGVRAAPLVGAPHDEKLNPFEERSPRLARVTGPSPLPDDVAYTRDQLEKFCSGTDRNEATYSTARLNGVRRGKGGATEGSKQVHVYEMYWADLVSVRTGLRMLEDLYQLLLHIANIGLLVINLVRAQHDKQRSVQPGFRAPWWNAFAWCHRLAVRCLTLPIPILNLLVLPAAALAIPALISDPAVLIVTAVLFALALLGICLLIAFSKSPQWTGMWLGGAVLVIIALILFIGISICIGHLTTLVSFMRIADGLLLCAAVWLGVRTLLANYDRIRPGASGFSIGCAAFIGVLALIELSMSFHALDRPHQMLFVAVRVIGWLLLAIGLSWIALLALQAGLVGFGLLSVCMSDKSERMIRLRACAVAWVTLALPIVSFFLLTTFVWTLAIAAIAPRLNHITFEAGGLMYRVAGPIPALEKILVRDRLQFGQVIQDLWVQFSGAALPCLAKLLGFAALLAIVAWGPSVISEFRVPPPQKGNDEVIARRRYARWLDGCAVLLLLAGACVCIAAPTITLKALFASRPQTSSGNATWGLVAAFGPLLVGVGGIWLLPARIGNFLGRIAVPIRAVLDIDSYLRLHPRDSNPRAKIFARYCSLLRYIANWAPPEQPEVHYDRVVIVSHSQGTVITADLLRYLQLSKAKDDSLSRLKISTDPNATIPVRLLTMGCPLRQLYATLIPQLYSWVPATRATLGETGLEQWLNAYRSGDYVGRYLWDAADASAHWDRSYDGPGSVTDEFCIGPGAHVHYWDGPAPVVARVIDDLIVT